MKTIDQLSLFPKGLPHPFVTIGNYDGVHLGHQQILKKLVNEARAAGGAAVVVTFDPHPLRILLPESAPPLLMTSEQKIAVFAEHGIDYVLVLHFDEIMARWSPRQFVKSVLVESVQARKVFVGSNFVFGYQQRGNTETLETLGREFGFAVKAVPQYTRRGTRVSSTLIRSLLLEGRVAEANRLLDHFFTITGTVVSGAGRGRKLTVPTLNVKADNELLPKSGVYITETRIGSTAFQSVTNIGIKPTFHESSLSIESHLIDVHEVAAPGKIDLSFLHRIRNEKKFASADELLRQIEKDVSTAKQFFVRLKKFKT